MTQTLCEQGGNVFSTVRASPVRNSTCEFSLSGSGTGTDGASAFP